MKRLMVTVMTLAKASHYRAEARALRRENHRVLAEAADTAAEARMKVERTELALSGLIRELYLTAGGSPLVVKEAIEKAASAADLKFASQLADKVVSWTYKAQETPELVKWAKTPTFKLGT